MEAEYVEEDDNDKNTESSKPSLPQTISFSQNNTENKSDNNQIEEEDEIDEEVINITPYCTLNRYLIFF